MTSRTKRRLAVLALALGLIAAAPQVCHFGAERNVRFTLPLSSGRLVAAAEEQYGFLTTYELCASPFRFMLVYGDSRPRLLYSASLNRPPGIVYVPDESITLRVACAVALACVWLLVVGGRILARSWTRKNPPSVDA